MLGAVISFVDLPMRFSCVVACGAMRDAAAKLSPRLEHALVLRRPRCSRRWELADRRAGAAPRPLPHVQAFLQEQAPLWTLPAPTVGLDAYTLSLELDVNGKWCPQEGAQFEAALRKKSVWIGTGTLSAGDSPCSVQLGSHIYTYQILFGPKSTTS